MFVRHDHQECRYTALRRTHNDLRIVAGADVDPSGFTLLAILRNEMYFLPAFLTHYRQLGVERFVFLNDRSLDGSFEYLIQQPDVTVVESDYKYSDSIEIGQKTSNQTRRFRILYLWRAMLYDKFAMNRWALQVDLDEFVHLPGGMNFNDQVDRLKKKNARVAWGVMLDVYPQNILCLLEQRYSNHLDESANWYFDGEPHLRLTNKGKPKMRHPGARARLYHSYGVDRLFPELGVRSKKAVILRRQLIWLGLRPFRYNALHKPVLIRWSRDCYFRNSHMTNLEASRETLLPIQHFRFTGGLYQKIKIGIEEKSYYRGSTDHLLLEDLLQRMEKRNGSFLYRKSRPSISYADFADTGNAITTFQKL